MNPTTEPGPQSPAIPAQPAASTAYPPAADRIEVRIFEMVKTEWGVAYAGRDHGLRERAGRTAAPGHFGR